MTYQLEEVFTPASPANLTFIERPQPEKLISRGLRNKGMQIIVYGHSGSGKTTLLYNLLESRSQPHIITRCTKGISIKDVLYDGFSQLGTFYTKQKDEKSEDKLSAGFKFGLSFLTVSGNGESKDAHGKVSERLVEIQKNPNLLARLFGEAECIWVIEDFHKLDKAPKRELSQIMKVFMDASNKFPKAKIIAVGAVESARQVVELDKEMNNRVNEVHVPLMTPEDLYEIMRLGEKHLNILIDNEVQEKIVAYSSGLPSVTHTLCSLACENKNVLEKQVTQVPIREDDLDFAISEYIHGKSDSLRSVYEQAIKEKVRRKSESPKIILEKILETGKIKFTIADISVEFKKRDKNYKSNNLRKYVMEFTNPERGEILKYNENGDTFSFSNPFIGGFCHIQYEHQKNSTKAKPRREFSDGELLQRYLNEEYKKFVREYNSSYL